jgi:two-component system, cell cycle sensor histidine kinase and response regulator CckA
VASPSHLRLERTKRDNSSLVSQVSLDSLPFPAALVDSEGIEVHNSDWAALGTDLVGCESVRTGIRSILGAQAHRFSQEIEDRGNHYRVLITPQELPTGPGALVILQRIEAPAKPNKPAESEKMETVGRLLGGVVHDFANLLTLISGYSEILLNRAGDRDSLRDELEEIRKAANRGARLTGQLLSFARGQTAQSTLLDLNEIAAGIIRMLRPIIGEHLGIDTLLAQDLGKIVADPGQIEQVLMNLVLNARDAMPQRGKIVVETRNFEVGAQTAKSHGITPGRYVMLSVSDTGHGIEPGVVDRLWEPLFTTKPEGKGTGLGLSTVRKIIQENRGAVWVRTAVGRGTTFFVCLPEAQPASSLKPCVDSFVLPCPPAVTAKAGTETVLIVEDEDGVRRLLRHVLESRGYKCLEAIDGEDALRIYQNAGQIHLVVTDMIMPHMGGRELAGRLLALDPRVRIVFMSGYTDDVLIRTGELGRGMPFLQKPLRPEALVARVREALDSPSRPFNPR